MTQLVMTDKIRLEIRKKMLDLGISQTELAKRLGVSNTSMSRALSLKHKSRQQLPDIWQGILEETGLELIVTEKQE